MGAIGSTGRSVALLRWLAAKATVCASWADQATLHRGRADDPILMTSPFRGSAPRTRTA